jgi:hypothetical protein
MLRTAARLIGSYKPSITFPTRTLSKPAAATTKPQPTKAFTEAPTPDLVGAPYYLSYHKTLTPQEIETVNSGGTNPPLNWRKIKLNK